ncbi:MAG: hypothetical protein WC450_07530 [Candidatus Omnitrophota bacterium]
MLFFKKTGRRLLPAFIIAFFCVNGLGPGSPVAAQSLLDLPAPGTFVSVTPDYIPMLLKGFKLYPDNPFQFDFIMDTGHFNADGSALRDEAAALIKYFLSALTIPEDELWVNLSPFEKERIIPDAFGGTEMGRDLLAQDYLLKQLTASLMSPDEPLGREFWDQVYQKAFELYGTTSIPVNTFNKIWIIPDEALVYAGGDAVFILKSHLKVLLEEDYLAARDVVDSSLGKALKIQNKPDAVTKELRDNTVGIVRDLLVPAIEKEVNEGKNFAKLRQIFHAVILAKWYKQNLKESILNKKYTDQRKIDGVNVEDKEIKEKIYQYYLAAFRKGVYTLIKEDYDPHEQKLIPRKYFLGGSSMKVAVKQTNDRRMLNDVPVSGLVRVSSAVGLPARAGLEPLPGFAAVLPSVEEDQPRALTSPGDKVPAEGIVLTGTVSSPVSGKTGPDNDNNARPGFEDVHREGFKTLGGIRYSYADIIYVMSLVREAWQSGNMENVRMVKNRVVEAVIKTFSEFTDDMVKEIIGYAQQEDVPDNIRASLRASVATVVGMATENAIDSYYMQKTLNEDVLQDELSIAIFMREEEGALVFQLMTNGLSLEEFEFRKSGVGRPVTRLGGMGQGMAIAARAASYWKSTVNLFDRKEYIGDENGAVFEMRMPRQRLEEAFASLRQFAPSSPLSADTRNKEEVGGIDFHPAYLNIRTAGRGIDLPFVSDPGILDTIDIPGLTPFIFNITPVYNLPFILGGSEESRPEFLSRRQR